MAAPRIVVASTAELAEVFAARCERLAAAAIVARGRFAFVIPGGSAAERLLPRLASSAIDWPRTDILYSDERFVPRSDPASSASASERLLFGALGSRAPARHAMVDDARDPAASARRYTGVLTAVLGDPPVADLALLGVGEDGHVASLFPAREAVDETRALVIVERDSPKPPSVRLTLSLPLLARSRAVVVAAFGAGKADVLRAIVHDPGCPYPAARLLRLAPDAELMLDPEAASRL